MKVLVDLRCCQFWPERGVPRYVQQLIFSVASEKPTWDFFFFYDDNVKTKALHHAELVGIGTFLSPSQIHQSHFDLLLVGWAFTPSGALPTSEYLLPWFINPRLIDRIASIVFDFIPGRFPEIYLTEFDALSRYQESLEFLALSDLLFTISQDTARDCKIFLRNYPENQIINLNGGPGYITDSSENDTSTYTKLKYEYWLCIGGDDPRKNISFLIEAYSNLKNRKKKLVIVGNLSNQTLRELNAMIPKGVKKDIHFTGKISDQEIQFLTKNAFGVVIPSLFEGLGLPLIEAYHLGTPAICSNNSALKEMAPTHLTFDPKVINSLQNTLVRCETEPDEFKKASLNFWGQIKKEYTWTYAGQQFALAIEKAKIARRPPLKAKGVNWILPLPPSSTGIAEFSHRLLESSPDSIFNEDRQDVVFQIGSDYVARNLTLPVLSKRDLPYFLQENRKCVLFMGNSHHFLPALDYISILRDNQKPVSLYIHDGNINGFWKACFSNDLKELIKFYKKFYPSMRCPENLTLENIDDTLIQNNIFGFKPLIDLHVVREIFTNSDLCQLNIKSELGHTSEGFFKKAFHPIFSSIKRAPLDKRKIRIGIFGISAPAKAIDKSLEAAFKYKGQRNDVEIVAAGYSLGAIREWCMLNRKNDISLHENVSHDDLMNIMSSCNLAIQLRELTHGEASGVVCELLSLGIPVIASDQGWFSEMREFLHLVPLSVTTSDLRRKIEECILKEASIKNFGKLQASDLISILSRPLK